MTTPRPLSNPDSKAELPLENKNDKKLDEQKSPENSNLAELIKLILEEKEIPPLGFKLDDELRQGSEKLLNCLLKDVEHNNVRSQTLLGLAWSSECFNAQAFHLLQKAASQGYSMAECLLGDFYSTGKVVKRNIEEAIKLYRNAAEKGIALAQCALGLSLIEKYNRTKAQADVEEGYKWLGLAAAQGFAKAKIELDRCYTYRIGGQEKEVARYELVEAAEKGFARAQLYYGQAILHGIFPFEPFEAFEWIHKSADQGEIEAQCLLGELLRQGTGCAKDREKAKIWTQKAADQGFARAQLFMGKYHSGGNFNKSLEWYLKATEQEYAEAEHMLAIKYRDHGRNNIPEDKINENFLYWCNKAATQNYAPAFSTLGGYYEEKQNYKEAIQCYTKAADLGNAETQFLLAKYYGEGKIVEKDLSLRVQWLLKAAKQGHSRAQAELAECYSKGEGVEKDLQEASKWFLCKLRDISHNPTEEHGPHYHPLMNFQESLITDNLVKEKRIQELEAQLAQSEKDKRELQNQLAKQQNALNNNSVTDSNFSHNQKPKTYAPDLSTLNFLFTKVAENKARLAKQKQTSDLDLQKNNI